VILLALVTLLLSPWHGPSLPTASADAIKYKLTVHGAPRQKVDLAATGLPSGWVASFCTRDLCSPFSYTMQLDPHGAGTIEFQAIRTDPSAPREARVKISGGSAVVMVSLSNHR
jgi:hypothetical protein